MSQSLRFIIMNNEGDVLTGQNKDLTLEFTSPAIMDNIGKIALTFKSSPTLPIRIAKKLSDSDIVLSIKMFQGQRADSMSITDAKIVGPANLFIAPCFKPHPDLSFKPPTWLHSK